MKSPQDIAALLAQFQPGGAPTTFGTPDMAATQPSPNPTDLTPNMSVQNQPISQPNGNAILQMLGIQQPPTPAGPAPGPTRRQRIGSGINDAANTFLFSLGQALSASAEHKGGGATNAGMGAAFSAPMQLAQMRLAQQQAQAKAALEAAQTQKYLSQSNQIDQLQEENRGLKEAQANLANAKAAEQQGKAKTMTLMINGQPQEVPTEYGIQYLKTQSANETRMKIANGKQALSMLQMGIDPSTGENLPDDKLPLSAQKTKATIEELGLKKQLDQNLMDYRNAMKDISAENAGTKAAQAQAQIAEISRKADQYDQYLGILRDRLNASNGPTMATRTKADQAGVIIGEGNRLIQEIKDAGDKFGPAAGRINNISEGIGSADPTVSTLYTHLKSFAALQPALHGARGIGYQKEFEDAVGGLQRNPEAVIASIKSLQGTANAFASLGAPKSNQAPAAPPAMIPVNPKTNKPYAPGDIAPNGKKILSINAKGPVYQP